MAIRSNNKINAGFSLSSMTDLVFLLLIFFVIVSTMVSPFALPVDLPKSRTSTSKEPPKVALRLEAEEVVKLNGSSISATDIEGALTTEMSRHGENDAIILHVAQEVPTGQMVTVLDIAKRHKWRIVLASAPTPPGETVAAP
ncbi:MAG: biopolymer transporter ExbD [Flavobacteriales bacterium]|jgi:biopolymer transport protein ExbD|nr:biopolymer transporter ExbD [Flavobacteriales bacterium]MBK6549769.1 biopolymer transporter ExbD [Flavobacteriales bacterium]MBK6883543.1 biopolymer transporter ExbD [Flavobacteriales bacterium]MBK7102285.1 biopolymer transporter ExbD [Flavobacteriales bacterium]MBK7113024.1 biopolymer transporter ExbD [Flavobacteriales bacterium]